jgi:hypothetical protein
MFAKTSVRLNLIASAEMPQIALDALEGLDGKAIRRLPN